MRATQHAQTRQQAGSTHQANKRAEKGQRCADDCGKHDIERAVAEAENILLAGELVQGREAVQQVVFDRRKHGLRVHLRHADSARCALLVGVQLCEHMCLGMCARAARARCVFSGVCLVFFNPLTANVLRAPLTWKAGTMWIKTIRLANTWRDARSTCVRRDVAIIFVFSRLGCVRDMHSRMRGAGKTGCRQCLPACVHTT